MVLMVINTAPVTGYIKIHIEYSTPVGKGYCNHNITCTPNKIMDHFSVPSRAK